MVIFPAIDIKDGKCVRLEEGDFEKEIVFGDDPLQMACALEKRGARYLHVVDLNAARGDEKDNSSVIHQIAQNVQIPIQTGGGIRNFDRIEEMLQYGVRRVILGTAAVSDPDFLKEACEKYPDSVAVSIDARDRFIATDGWKNITEIRDTDFLERIENWGVSAVVYTDISKDGMLEGINLDAILDINSHTDIPVIASGGITDIKDIEMLEKHSLYGAIIGTAMYSGTIPIEELEKYF